MVPSPIPAKVFAGTSLGNMPARSREAIFVLSSFSFILAASLVQANDGGLGRFRNDHPSFMKGIQRTLGGFRTTVVDVQTRVRVSRQRKLSLVGRGLASYRSP